MKPTKHEQSPNVVSRPDLDPLVSILEADGYQVIGPTIRDEAIVYEPIESLDDLPSGWSDEQEPARYRLHRRDDQALFQYAVAVQSWKRYLQPPAEPLVQIRNNGSAMEFIRPEQPRRRYAFLGARSCELRAIGVTDRVFIDDQYQDAGYLRRRQDIFIVAVHCGRPAATCFCTSMGTGPRAESGFDLALTEILAGEHRFVVEAGSDAGRSVLERLTSRPAEPADREAADQVVARAAAGMRRSMQTDGLKELLYASSEHPRWEQVAERCLACTNCTMVCPTCFCSTVEDSSDLAGQSAERTRYWDSCFSQSFSYIHGGSVRTSVAARYRQWLTHKLASWQDQFGTSGCVGCGRCITWCPVGIDITQEVRAIQESPPKGR